MEYQRKDLPEKVIKTGWIVTAIGLILVIASYLVNTQRAAFNNLIGFMFLLTIAAGAVVLVALEYLAGAVWSTPMRRVSEFLGAAFPFAVILAIPLFFNLHSLFEWTHKDIVQNDAALQGKSSYLNVSSFTIRFIIIVVVFYLFYWLFTRNSRKQDVTKNQRLTWINVKLSAPFMPVAAFGLSILAIDWMMSLAPHWYSTIFGFYFLTGVVLAGLGATSYIVVKLNEKGYFQPPLRDDHYYSLGALMFAFINFWAYIAFSQFLLIWYANIPEETLWFLARWNGSWKYISVALIFVRFAVPYVGLLSQPSKMDPKRLKIMGLWLVFSQLFDLYWLVMPTLGSSIIFGWMEIAFPVLVIGIIILVFSIQVKKHNLMPIGDPKLQRGIDFEL
jgi:hypothetical protein